jgi:hypothetical protein
MQYVIRCKWGNYYTGPNTNYVWRLGYWSVSFNNATVFNCLEQAKDIHKNVKDTYPHSQFLILEYIPATTGKVILSEKDMLIEDLQEVVDRIDNTPYNYPNVKVFKPSIEKALKFIKENIND